MAAWKKYWQALRGKGSSQAPDLSEQEEAQLLEQARARLPIPVFWLLGKTQSGKTSIIRALTRSPRSEIGDGFRPCTRTSSLYSFPDEESGFVRFLDTRGLGEVEYDPTEDLHQFQNQAHLLVVVMKAMDHAQEGVINAVRSIRRRRKDWPIVVAQTALHEGYPPGMNHIEPYPYKNGAPYPPSVPQDLARSLLAQQALFEGMNARFVPLDFTMSGDGYDPEDYGLEEFWDVIEETLPLGLRAMMRSDRDGERGERSRKANALALSYAAAAGGAAGVPVPYADIPVVVGAQIKMCREIARIYNRELDARRLAEIASGLGIAWLGRLGVRELAKVIPGVGSAIAAVYSAASTYALGRTLAAYFQMIDNGADPDPEMFRKLYAKQFEEGRQRLKTYFRKGKEMQPQPQPQIPQAEGAGS